MNKNALLILFSLSCLTISVHAADMGVPIQLRLKSPSGLYPNEIGVTIKIQILSSPSGCVLREENFSGQTLTDGGVSVILGSGVRAGYDPNLSLNQVFDNSSAKVALTCLAANGAITSTGQTYNPLITDGRTIRFSSVILGDPIAGDFPLKSVPYAVQAESVGGKVASDILVKSPTTQLTQANLEALLADSTKLSNIQNLANGGSVASATSATTAVNFTGVLAGDISGNQTSISVNKIKGIVVSAVIPALGQVLQYNGTQYTPVAIPSAPVSSVAGRTGVVTLTNADIAGLGSAAILNAGLLANNLVQLDGTAKIPVALMPSAMSSAVTDTAAATSLNTPSTLMKRDASGNASLNSLSSNNVSTQNIYIYEATNTNRIQLQAPLTFSNYNLTLPTGAGSAGQLLATDGLGNLSWSAISVAPAQITQSAAALGQVLKWSGSAWVPAADNNSGGTVTSVASANSYLSVATATTAPVLTANVGTVANTLAAGNDSRITGAFQSATALGGDLVGSLPNPSLATVVTAGIATKITYDVKGRVTSGTVLAASDIPSLATSVLTAGTLPVVRGGTGSTTLAANALMMSDATGSSLSGVTCTTNQVMYWTGTAWACNSLSGLIDLSMGSVQGSLMYRNATNWTVLAAGTAGQFLKTGGAGGNPSWTSQSVYFSGNGSNTAVPAASTYIYPFSGAAPKTSLSAANHAGAVIAVPKAGTLTNLSVTFSAAAAATFKCTLFVGATTATIAPTTILVTGNGIATVLSNANTAVVTAGSLLDLVCVNTAGSASVVPLAYSVEFITP